MATVCASVWASHELLWEAKCRSKSWTREKYYVALVSKLILEFLVVGQIEMWFEHQCFQNTLQGELMIYIVDVFMDSGREKMVLNMKQGLGFEQRKVSFRMRIISSCPWYRQVMASILISSELLYGLTCWAGAWMRLDWFELTDQFFSHLWGLEYLFLYESLN